MPISTMGYKLLVRQILTNSLLTSEDRQVVKDIVYGLDLTGEDSLTDVNDKWVIQQRLEASIIYLLCKYEKAVGRAEAVMDGVTSGLEEVEASARLDTPKEYSNAESRKAYVRLDPDVAVHKLRVNEAKQAILEAKELYNDIDRLAKTVFRRDKKIENMNVNVRRQMTADENAE
jgi:hypothetical protein